MPTSDKKASAYDAFSAVDAMVSKPVLGSDGAASWQEFKAGSKDKSRGVAPHLPLKKTDKLSGIKCIEDERRQEQRIREMYDERPMGSGYTLFKRKNTQEDASERKRRKRILERKRPDDQLYFIKSDTFVGWKEDYVFTTRDGNTGYYWDGMDSLKRINVDEDAGIDVNNKKHLDKPSSSKKKKSKDKITKFSQKEMDSSRKYQQLPEGWSSATDPRTGKTYYYNFALNKTMWDVPKTDDNENETKTSVDADRLLPQGWEMAKDPSTGMTYFYNRVLNKTSWEHPE
mmetsp:Transcript_16200/g.30632  ORF Transcript_16200/g.30632 Transcript_16200/m.30632 type:complete len:286 (-) Transcript_16200:2028-2885(-)